MAYTAWTDKSTADTIAAADVNQLAANIVDTRLPMMRVGSLMQTAELITLSSADPWLDMTTPSCDLDIANFVDYVPHLYDVQVKLKWTSTQVTGTITLASTAVTGSGTNLNGELSAGDLVWIEKLNQFRTMAAVTSTTAATVSEPGTAAAGADIYLVTRSTSPSGDFTFTAAQVTSTSAFSLWINYGVDTGKPENYTLLRAMAEAYAYDGEYGTITLPSTFGSLPAGTYTITSITLANVGSTSAVITCSAGLSSGALSTGSATFNVYPHRIAGSTTTARHYEVTDAAVMSDGIYNVLGMRTRDYGQGHMHSFEYGTTDGSGAFDLATVTATWSGVGYFVDQATDAINETPRTGPRTHPRAMIGNLYVYIGEYTA